MTDRAAIKAAIPLHVPVRLERYKVSLFSAAMEDAVETGALNPLKRLGKIQSSFDKADRNRLPATVALLLQCKQCLPKAG